MKYLVVLTMIITASCSSLEVITVCSKEEQQAVKQYVSEQTATNKSNSSDELKVGIICNCHQVVVDRKRFRNDSTYISNILNESVVVE